MDGGWRARAGSLFTTQKAPATGSRGMAVTNHPLGSAAAAEMLAAGGNAVDAAIAAFFTLSVVEPMMTGPLGGGLTHLRLADGRHVIVDGLSAAPLAGSGSMYTPASDDPARRMETLGRANTVGALAVASPGALRAWCDILARYGTLPLADVMEPAIRHASRGFIVTTYLADCIADAAADLVLDPEMARVFLPGGNPLKAGARLVQGDTAETLRTIAQEGPDAFYRGALGQAACDWFARNGGILTREDLACTAPVEREPVRGTYRGHEVVGPPAPSAGGMHMVQMLNFLEGFDLRALGFGTAPTLHRIAEALKLAFADRAMVTADPAFVRIPVERLISRDYAGERRAEFDPGHARDWAPGLAPLAESADTTHVTTADAAGNVVAMTQTINGLFGARVRIPGLGLIPNNYMCNFDPRPGLTQSVAPGKRITTSMAPTIVLRDGRPVFALGLPGGLKIFGSAMQAVLNMIDHGMSPQEAVEAPRIWTQGLALEAEGGVAPTVREELAAMGHKVAMVPTVGGGMNLIAFGEGGTMTGAACWRADGTPIGVAGGLAKPGVRFVLEQARR
ncbi:gamma-glutamyltransferase [Roseomonas gilardii]|uniref:gamma-glutamyltransferase n=1 Tax=Roseomonas gilardii TaxID=257708 RepID=UPI0011A23A51|nr:gamma-glutamyltransferase [Roseomonas gilardii]